MSTRQHAQLGQKKDKISNFLNTTQNSDLQLNYCNIVNLAGIDLSDVEKDVLCRGLKFGIPLSIRKESIVAVFKLAWLQLPKAGMMKDAELQCKVEMASLVHRYSNSKIYYPGFHLSHQHISATKSLKNRKEIIITKPDKGNSVVLLTKSDYGQKMWTILEDDSKFVPIGDAETKDKTTQQERALQAILLRALKKGDTTRYIYDWVQSSGSMRPYMYGVPKLHKDGVLLRPILSMINSPQHELEKWLT